MEIKTSHWLLDSLACRRAIIPILETAICRGNSRVHLYGSDSESYVIKKSATGIEDTKSLLLHFLYTKFPDLDSSLVNKPVCYAYLKSDRRILTPGDIRDLVYNQLHGLRFETIVLTTPLMHELTLTYKVHLYSKGNILKCDVFEADFFTEKAVQTQDQKLGDDALRLSRILVDIAEEESKMFVYDLRFEMVIDSSARAQLCNIIEIRMKEKREGGIQNSIPGMKLSTIIRFHDHDTTQPKIRRSSMMLSAPDANESQTSVPKLTTKKKSIIERLSVGIPGESGYDNFMEIVNSTLEKGKKFKENKSLESTPTLVLCRSKSKILPPPFEKSASFGLMRKSQDDALPKQFRSDSEAQISPKTKISIDEFNIPKLLQIQSPKFDPLYERFFKKPYRITKRTLTSEISEITNNLLPRFNQFRCQRRLETITPGLIKHQESGQKLIEIYMDEEKSRIQNKMSSPNNMYRSTSYKGSFNRYTSDDSLLKPPTSTLLSPRLIKFEKCKSATLKLSDRPLMPSTPK